MTSDTDDDLFSGYGIGSRGDGDEGTEDTDGKGFGEVMLQSTTDQAVFKRLQQEKRRVKREEHKKVKEQKNRAVQVILDGRLNNNFSLIANERKRVAKEYTHVKGVQDTVIDLVEEFRNKLRSASQEVKQEGDNFSDCVIVCPQPGS